MRYHALFLTSVLSTVFAQSAPSAGTGFARPTGSVPELKNGSATWYKPVPYSRSSSASFSVPSLSPSSEAAVIEPSSSSATHIPFTRPAGPYYTNATSGFALPTGKVEAVRPSGTGASAPTHLPHTKGVSALPNGTESSKPTGTGALFHQSGTAGFVKPTCYTKPVPNLQLQNATAPASSPGRQPFTKSSGAFFSNGTATAVDTGAPHPSGTGFFASSGFAIPTNGAGKVYTAPETNRTRTAVISKSASGRLPFSKGQSAFFGNSTRAAGATETKVFIPSGTGASSRLAKPTQAASASGKLPLTKTGALYLNSTVTVVPVGTAQSTGVPSGGVRATGSGIPASSGRLPFTKSSGPIFANSTSTGRAASTTGAFSSGALPSAIMSTGPSSGRLPYTRSGALFLNSTATTSVLPTGTASPPTEIPSSSASVSTSATALPFTRSTGASFTNTTSTVLPLSTGTAFSTGVSLPISTSVSAASGFASPTTFSTSISVGTVSSTVPKPTTTGTSKPIAEYYQCGGLNFAGSSDVCAEGTVCKYWNPYYSQCVDARYA